MPTRAASPFEVLLAELSAALPARRSALELERHFMAPDQAERVNRGLFQIRVAEARLKPSAGESEPALNGLAAVAVAEAESLEEEAEALGPLLAPELAGRQIGVLRLVCALFHLARIGEGRARAHFSYARLGKHLLGFEDALELAPENELFFLALRRFRRLLDEKGAWSRQDLDWLRLRCVTAPGRLRLRAAALRAAAEAAAQVLLPEALEEKRAPFIAKNFEPAAALAWAVAGFTPKEALAWGSAGIEVAEQAQAWRDRGIGQDEAVCWAELDLLPDEAAAFKACGADDPETAMHLRRVLGDVEHLLAWHRAGFEVAEVLRVRASGVSSVSEALKKRESEELGSRGISSFYQSPAKAVKPKTGSLPEAASSQPVESYPAPESPEPEAEAPVLDPSRWAFERAKRLFGVDAADEAAALAAGPANGGAWIAWGVFEKGSQGEAVGDLLSQSLNFAGGRMDVVSASEGVALPMQGYDPPSMSVKDAWQGRLDERLRSHQAEPQAGRWQLYAWEPARAWLFWGLVFKSAIVPWGQAIDFDSQESWQQRWKRKTAEFGDESLLCPVRIGRTASGAWWMGLKASIVGSQGREPMPFDPAPLVPAWRDAMSDFCLKMGIGSQAAAWHLLAGEPKEPD